MQPLQLLRDVFWNTATLAGLPGFVLSLALSALLGILIGQVYVRFGQSLSNRRLFASNFLLLTVTTTLIITVVKSSLALSLGLVGALSIVRFRAAIKEPEELAFLFLAISAGLGLGAGQALLTIVALIVILSFVMLRSLARPSSESPNLYLTVTSPSPGKLTAGQILEVLTTSGARAALKRFDETPEMLEAAFLVDFRSVSGLEDCSRRLRDLSRDVRVSCLDDRGLAA